MIVIEKSDRLLPKAIDLFPGLKLDVDGKPIPIRGLFSEKMPPQPLLEMCDHVCHRAQRQYKFHLGCDLLPEFVAVFPRAAPFARYKGKLPDLYAPTRETTWHCGFRK